MRRDSSEERRQMDDNAHREYPNLWRCPDCARRVYGLGVHWSGTGICKTSGPIPGGGERHDLETGRTLATGVEPDVSRNDTSGSVPPRTGADE